MSNESPHLTVEQLAERYHTDIKGIYNLRQRRKLPPALTRGGRLLWPLAVIEEHERALLAADPKAPDVIEAEFERLRAELAEAVAHAQAADRASEKWDREYSEAVEAAEHFRDENEWLALRVARLERALGDHGEGEGTRPETPLTVVETFPGELAMLRGLLGVIRVTAKHGDMDEVRRLVAEYDTDEGAAYAELEVGKVTATGGEITRPIPTPLRWGLGDVELGDNGSVEGGSSPKENDVGDLGVRSAHDCGRGCMDWTPRQS